jgi:peptidoglycan/LPS O-acetylase OafA/YrhL
LTALVLLGGLRRKILIPLGALALAVVHLVLRMRKYDAHGWSFHWPVARHLFSFGSDTLSYKDRIVWSLEICVGAVIASFFMLWVGRYFDYFTIVTVSYVTVYIGLTNFKRLPIVKGADYSYGIYLYGFVIQQLFVYLAAPRFWWLNVSVCIPLAALFDAFSWHFVEKPTQRLKWPLALAEQYYLPTCPCAGRFRNRIRDRHGTQSRFCPCRINLWIAGKFHGACCRCGP